MITAQELQAMRYESDKTLPDEIIVKRLAKTADGGGGFTEQWLPVQTLPGRMGLPLGGETDQRANSTVRLADEDLHTIWLTAGADIRKTDRIEWDGRDWEVYAVLARGTWELFRRVRVKEM